MRFLATAIGMALLIIGAALSVEASGRVDVSGVWEVTLQTPMGDQVVEATFVQESEAIRVSMTGPQGFELKGEGTIKEADLEWTMLLSGPMGELVLVFKGKVDGEQMAGEVQMGEYGSAAWSAKKKKG